MKLSGETVIAAPRAIVWEALNDETLLIQCISGCEALERVSDTELVASLTVKLGPVKAKFKGDVRLEDIDAPISYKLVGEGKGAAGFARGHADVALEELDDGVSTKLVWAAEASVGGKLAQMGARLIDSTAKKYADDFFSVFSALAQERAEAVIAVTPSPESVDVSDKAIKTAEEPELAGVASGRRALSPLVWASAVILAVLVLLYVLLR